MSQSVWYLRDAWAPRIIRAVESEREVSWSTYVVYPERKSGEYHAGDARVVGR